MRRFRKSTKLYIGLAILVIGLNLIAWISAPFCDWYIEYIFPIWLNTYGRVMGWSPFSVGEYMLLLAAIIVIVAVLGLVVYAIVRLALALKKEKLKKWKSVLGCFYKFFAWTFIIVCLIMTLNCTILYHASTFSETYFTEVEEEYTLEELIAVRNLVVEKCNELATKMERDGEGYILTSVDILEQAKTDMQKLGESYRGLDGFYPTPKPLAASDFFSQQYMQGYYFPFSLEANYNQVMYIMNIPATVCHELAHLKGYIFEDEANFIAFLACVNSKENIMEYSGYLSVLGYLDNDFYKATGKDAEKYLAQPRITKQVLADNEFLLQEEWDRINGKAVIDTEVVDSVSDTFTETVLKVNGVEDGMISYSRVVKLLLLYYKSMGVL